MSFVVDYTSYCTAIERFINEGELNFKSNHTYQSILEHVSYELGLEYLTLIMEELKIDKETIKTFCSLNDSIGKPTLYEYNDFKCSPTSLRYIYHANIILRNVKDGMTINEIGGGYGGLCLAISHFMKHFNIKISGYNIIDLGSPIKLQKRYLSHHQLNFPVNWFDAMSFGKEIGDGNNFLISNYAFSEIKPEYRYGYLRELFPKMKHGFLIWNDRIYPDIHRNIDVMLEKPMTNENYDNYFVSF